MGDLHARRASVEALTAGGTALVVAERLSAAALALKGIEPGDGPSAQLRVGYKRALGVLEQLYRWDASVQAAASDSAQHIAAARRNAEIAAEGLRDAQGSFVELVDVLERMANLTEASELEALRSSLCAIPLPMRMIATPRGGRGHGRPSDPVPVRPRVICLLRLGDQPITGPVLVRPNTAYNLQIEARVLDWPDWAERIHIHFLSRWQGTAADVPSVTLDRPDKGADGVWRAVSDGGVVVRATPARPDTPLLFTVEAEIQGESQREPIEVVGYAELALHAYDPAVDYITGSEVIDQRVHEVLLAVGASGAPEAERKAFADLFITLANEAQILVANRTFRGGQPVLEAEFQSRLLERAQSELGATNVRTGAEVGGGEMDIVYLDDFTAELKIERNTPASLDRAAAYLGQPAQYAAGAGRQLSILCILDISERAAPVGVLANGIGLLRPALAGLEDPDYPALVGVIIVSGGLPLPSAWAGKRVATTDELKP